MGGWYFSKQIVEYLARNMKATDLFLNLRFDIKHIFEGAKKMPLI